MNNPVHIHISPDTDYQELIKHTLQTIFFNKGLKCAYAGQPENALLSVGYVGQNDLVISEKFHQLLNQNIFDHKQQLSDNGNIVNKYGNTDIISTISYLINSFQEYNSADLDVYGRFRYVNSLQYKSGNIEVNRVQQLIDELFTSHPKLKGLRVTSRRSKVFLTHDIDSVYGAIKEDGKYALTNLRFVDILRLIFNAVNDKPDWLNMDKIIKLEDEYGFKSTFYWLLVKNKENSDYDFHSPQITKIFNRIKSEGWENGLHKSMGATGFGEEIKTFGSMPQGNRFHFLKFNLPDGYKQIEESELQLDTTLGFSESFGLRNSFGQPFIPFNLAEKRPYRFVEVPQLMMDRTFYRDGTPPEETKKKLFDFVEKNKYNCVFTINWHNNFFSGLKYHGYLELYRDMLAGFKELGVEGITQSQLIDEYYKPFLATSALS